MRKLVVTIETPDELDPVHVANVMCDDLYYSNRDTDDIGPYMEQIFIHWTEEEK